LIAGARRAPALETAFSNLSIDRLYHVCRWATDPAFGEQPVTIDSAGQLQTPSGPLEADYVVAPAKLGIEGRLLARNAAGGQVLIAPANKSVTIPAERRAAALRCPAPPQTR
jgi:hypothetical protein